MKVRAAILLLVCMGLNQMIFGQEAKVSHDQYFIISEKHSKTGDVLGQFYVNCTDSIFNERLSKYSFGIVSGNSGDAFSISSTGILSVEKPSAISHGNDYNLQIRITVDDSEETVSAQVKVLHADSVIFIDPSYSGEEAGTRDKPYNNWNGDIKSSRLQAGFAYLWKRGSTCQAGDNIYVENNSSKAIHIGAYGTGSRPVLDGRNTHDNNGILVGASWKCPADINSVGWNINIMDIDIKGFNAENRNSLRVAPSSKNVQLHRVRAEGGHYNGCFYLGKECSFQPQNIVVQDCEAKNNPVSHLLKAEAGGVKVINFWGKGAPNGTGISFPSSPNNSAKYFKLSEIGETGINIRKENTHFQYGYITGGYRGSVIYFDGANEMYPHNSSLKNIIFENTYSYAVLAEDAHNLVLEGLEIRGCKTSGIAIRSDISGLEISKCKIYNSKGHAIDIVGNSTDIVVDYNILYNNTNNGVNIASCGNPAKLHNNVLVYNGGADAMNTSGQEAEFINNVYADISKGWGQYSNNHNIENEACYQNPQKGDFQPIGTSFIVNHGVDLGYVRDFNGISVPQADAPDIGAIEYYEGEPDQGGFGSGNTNQDPSIQAQSFNYNAAVGNKFVGKVIAVDPDKEQTLSYSILSGNENSIFTIDEASGEIICSSVSFDPYIPHSYQFLVQVADDGDPVLSKSADIQINITPGQKIVYIDPSIESEAEQSGTLEQPYDSWEDITWMEGFTYLQKRATYTEIEKLLLTSSNIKIGAYGQGEKPVLEYTGSEYAVKTYEKSGITIDGIHIQAHEAVSCLYFAGSTSDSVSVENCEMEGASYGIRAIDIKSLKVSYSKFTQLQEAIYSYAEKTEIFYNLFAQNVVGLNVSSPLSEVLVYNNVFSDNQEGMSVSYSSSTIYNNIFYLMKPGDVALNHKLDKFISDNNIFYPEQQGFLKIADQSFDYLKDYQKNKGLDLNSFAKDPKFIDIYVNNFDISQGSPALNKGVDLGQERDFFGNFVPFAGKPDIGIIEKQMDAILGVEENPTENNAFSLFPNPAADYVSVQLDDAESESYTLKISNTEGKTIMSKVVKPNRSVIQEFLDLSKYTAGTYIISLVGSSQLISNKLTIY